MSRNDLRSILMESVSGSGGSKDSGGGPSCFVVCKGSTVEYPTNSCKAAVAEEICGFNNVETCYGPGACDS